MSKGISASAAKNNFGGLLDDVAALGRVDIFKHGRLVAVVMSPRALDKVVGAGSAENQEWSRNHMIPSELAVAAKVVRDSAGFDDDRRDATRKLLKRASAKRPPRKPAA